MSSGNYIIRSIMFDFGGVVADEGFKEGLRAIAIKNGRDPDRFFEVARHLMYASGYVTGRTNEHAYWEAVRKTMGINDTDAELRNEIISRFRIRPAMLEEPGRLRKHGLTVSVLSDQTNWLDEIDRLTPFSRYFDHVFNSFYIGKSKEDTGLFDLIAERVGAKPEEIILIDDNAGNIERASSRGWKTICFRDTANYRTEMDRFGLPG